MKQAIIFVFAIVTAIACNNKKKEAEVKDATAPVATTPEPGKDSADIRAVIIDFYTWYASNYKKLMSFDLYRSLKKNNAAPYELNQSEVKKYRDFVRDSITQLGAEFDKNLAIIFAKADSAFKANKKDDVPAYFDYDWYTNGQENASWFLNGLKTSSKWIINVKGDEASVEVGTPENKDYVSGMLLLYAGMKKENGQWTIAKIGND